MADKGMEHYSLKHPDEPPSNTREKYARTSFLSSEFWKRNKDRIILCFTVIAVCFIASGLIGWYLHPTERFLDFRPRPPKDADETLIWIKTSGRPKEQNHWVQDLDQFIKTKYFRVYGGIVNDRILVMCNFDIGLLPSEKEFCTFDLKFISPNCSSERHYGYDVGRPCVLVRINPVKGWYPEPYRNSTFPEAMPPDLKEAYDPRYVYISCDGVTPADRENMGPISYHPFQGIPNYYFPLKTENGYMWPFVFVHFERPQTGVTVSIECKAWAANIKHDEENNKLKFQLLVD